VNPYLPPVVVSATNAWREAIYWSTGSGAGTTFRFVPPRRDDGKGDQFPDAPTGVREPPPTKPRSPAGAIALPLP
jgi:hypothetical protein